VVVVRSVNRGFSGRNCVDTLKSQGKSFDISKWEVWEAFRQVKANKGAAGVDGQSIADFEADLKNNLFRIWNRMSSGTYFPPAVRAVEIPKQHGGGTRMLGIPTVADRVAQTVVARHLGVRVEQVSTRIPTVTGRAGRLWTRRRYAGIAAGNAAG
jgi:RNA-directed DNA polymerase